jgi:hypothetical protein
MVRALDSGSFLDEVSFSNRDFVLGVLEQTVEAAIAPGQAASSVPLVQTLPAGSSVKRARATVTAGPSGYVTIGGVAQVRDSSGTDLVVDFQGMRTVDRLTAPVAFSAVRPWAGTQFAFSSPVDATSADQSFTEIQTERLLVTFAGFLSADQLGAQGSVRVLTPPADLELLVNGTRAWFNAGPAKPGGDPDDPAAYRTTVDLTDAVTAAVTAAPASEDVKVEIVLRSSVPGRLSFEAPIQFQLTHAVSFPEGSTRVVDAEEEGVYPVPLPLPPEATGWSIHEVQMTVAGSLPPLRVLEPDGPVPSEDAHLVLDPDHAVLVGLPAAGLARLATLTAIRIPVGVDPAGAELAGVLRADANGAPGDPLPQGQLGPVTLAGGDLERQAWTTLPLGKEQRIAPGEALWAGLQLARGRVSWPLAIPAGPPAPPALSPDAPLRRQLPNGAFRPLSPAGDVPTSAATIRLAGEAPSGTPIPALEVDVAGTASGVSFTPTADGDAVVIGFEPPLTKAGTPSAFGDQTGTALALRLTTRTPGSVSFADVRIAYTEDTEEPA